MAVTCRGEVLAGAAQHRAAGQPPRSSRAASHSQPQRLLRTHKLLVLSAPSLLRRRAVASSLAGRRRERMDMADT